MAFRDWLKEYRESQGTVPSSKSSSDNSEPYVQPTLGPSDSEDVFSFRDALKKYRDNTCSGWADHSIGLIKDFQNRRKNWFDDSQYQSWSDGFDTLLSKADYWRKQNAGNDDAIAYIDSVVDVLSKAKSFSFDDRKYYSKWETADDYQAALQNVQNRKAMLDADIDTEWEINESMYFDIDLLRDKWHRECSNPDEIEADKQAFKQNYGVNYDDAKDVYNQKKDFLNQAKKEQKLFRLSAVSDQNSEFYDPEYKSKSVYVSTKIPDNDWWGILWSDYGLGYGDLTYEYINNTDGVRSKVLDAISARSFISSSAYEFGEYKKFETYDYMTDDEISLYNYYYSTGGKEVAEDYLRLIQESLNYQYAEYRFNNLNDNTFLELLFGIEAGLDQFTSGIENLFSTEDYIPASSTQMLSQMVREDLSDDGWKLPDWAGGASLGQIAYDTVTTTSNMAPSILTSQVVGMINPLAGTIVGGTLMGGSAAGNAYQFALNSGYDKVEARIYSTMIGISESTLQYAIGGISSLGGVSSNKLTKLLDGVDNALFRVAGKIGVNMASEGLEEGLQEILEPMLQNAILHMDEDVNWGDVFYSGLLGAITAGLLEGPKTIVEDVSTTITGKKLQSADISAQRLSELGKTFSADTVAYQLADKVNKNTSAYTMGRLFNEIGAEITEQNISDLQRSLEGKGVDSKSAKILAKAFADVVLGDSFTTGQIEAINANEDLSATVRDVIIDKNTTFYQRNAGYKEALMALANEETAKQAAKEAKKTAKKAANSAPVEASHDNVTAESNVITNVENGSDGVAEASDDGNAHIVSTNEAVTIKEVASIKDGKMTLRLEDGSTVNAKDIAYSSKDEALVYEAVAEMGVNASAANLLVDAFRTSNDVSAPVYVKGIQEAYTYGSYNIPVHEMLEKSSFTSKLTEYQRMTAYKLGELAGGKKTAAEQATFSKKKKSGKNQGKVYFDKGAKQISDFRSYVKENGVELSTVQETAIKTMEKLSAALGIDFYVFQSYEKDGKRVYINENGEEVSAPSGKYYRDGRIYIDLNAGNTGKGTMLYTVAHELTHFIRQWSPAKFKVLANFLMKQYGENGKSVRSFVNNQIAKAKRNGRDISFGEAYEEVVADSMETILNDGNVVQMMAELRMQDKTLWEKICDWFKNLAEDLKAVVDAYKGYNPDSAEGKMVADMQDVILTLESLYSDALVDASENYQTANAQKNTTWDGGAKMSIRDAFYSEVDSWDGKSKRTFVVGNTSDVLKSIGVKDSRIIWHGEKMGRIMREHSGMDKAVIKQVPQILENPVVILESKQSSSRLVIFGTVTDTNGTPVTAILELQPTNKGGQILNMNIIASAYGKDNTRGLVESSGLVYIDPNKTRTKSWMQSVGLQLPSDATILGSVGSITYPNGKVKIESVPYSQYMLNDSKKTDDVKEKFSLRDSVEEAKDLVAFHNITESLLMDVLNRNSLLMPSLAVTNKGMTDFGDISLLFDKSTIDPNANKENKLYGADAWTPTQTQLKKNAKFDVNKTVRAVNTMKNRIGSKYVDELLSITPKQFKDEIIKADGSIYDAYAHHIGVQTAYAMEKGIITNIPTTKSGTVDRTALQAQLNSEMDTDDGWRLYKKWLNNISDTIITSYDKATNQDVLNNMKSQPATAKVFKLSENGELVVPAVEYSSIDDMRNNKNRLSDNAAEATKAVANEFLALANKIDGNTRKVVDAINATFANRYSTADIVKSFRSNGIEISNETAVQLQSLYKKAVELPTQYFEAKPHREIGLDEIKAAVMPADSSYSEIKQKLEERGIHVVEYEANSKESRIEAINSVDEIKFSNRDYSYETLTSKPDMVVTTIIEPVPNNRADVVVQAKKNAATVGKFNPKNGSVSVHVDDTNSDVILTTDGLKHGLRRLKNAANNPNFFVTLKAGEILKNSIKINEFTPSKENATGSYVLIGAAQNTGGEMYIVRSVVNQFNNELDSMDVLYAINAKKELAATKSPRSTAKPLSVTSSNISIAELLDIVNQYFPDILPEDVLKHYGYDARPDGDLGKNALYSDRDPEAIRVNKLLENENAKLKEDVSYLKEMLKLQRQVTGGTKFTKTSVEAAAKQLMKNANAKGNTTELVKLLSGFYEYIAKGEELTWEGVMEQAQPAVEWLQNHYAVKKQISSYAQDILRELRGSRVYLDEQQKKEASYTYGSFKDFRNRTMGSLIITNSGSVSLDTKWQELSNSYPNIFDPETATNDMPAALLDAIDRLRNMTDMDIYGYDEELAAQDLRYQVYDSYWSVSTLYTVADVKNREILKLKGEHAKRMSELRDYHKEKTEQLKAEHKEALKRVKQEYRDKAEAKQQKIIEKYQESRKKGIDSRNRTAMRHRIKDVVNELNQYLLRGTKERHVPIELQKAVAEALDAVNMDTVGAEERIAKLRDELLKAKTPEKIQEISRKIDRVQEIGDKMNGRLQKLKDAYEQFVNSDDPLIANSYDEVISNKLQSVIDTVGDTPLRDMTLSQLEDVYDMYRMVLTTIRNANKAFKAKKSESISTIANMVMMEVERAGGKKKLAMKGMDGIQSFGWNNLKPVYAFEHIGSDNLTDLFNNVRKGEDVWAVDVTEAREYYLDKSKKHHYDSWDFKKQYRFTSTSGMDFDLSLEQIMSLYAYSKRDKAAEHLKKGGIVIDETTEITIKNKLGVPIKFNPTEATAYNISEETLADIVSKLTDEQKAFVDEMQDYLSTVMGAKGNEVSLDMYGIKLFKEKFYFPLKSAHQFMAKAKEQQNGDVKIKNYGFSKETVPKASNPIVLTPFMNVWANHVNEMSMYHAFVLPMEDFYRVYNYKTPTSDTMATESVEMFIQNAYGKSATKYIDQLLKDLNGGARTDSTTGIINKMMGLFKKGAVFASMSVVIQQPSAIAKATALVDTKYFIGPKVDHKRHKALWEEVKQYAPVAIIKEMGYFDTNMGKSTQDFILGKEYSGFKEKMEALVTDGGYRDELLSRAPALADEIAWCGIWEAVKRETKAKNPGTDVKSETFLKMAGERFTDVIVKTQVYDSVLSRSGLMRSKDTGMKMATAFMAESTTSINMIADALLQGKRGNIKYCRSAIGAVIASHILNAILVSFVYAGRDDDDDETYLEKYIGSFVGEMLESLNPASYIPFIKDIMSIVQGYAVERSDMAVISDLWNAWKNLSKDNVSCYRKVEGFAGSVAQIFGLPVKNIMRDARGIYQTISSFVDGEHTTLAGIGHALKGAITGKTVSDSQQLYEAYLNGDTEQIARVKGRFENQNAINNAISKALRENDPRIKEAAQTQINGDPSERVRIARQIIADGFNQDDVVRAINAEINAMTSSGGSTNTNKKTGFYTAADFALEIANGDYAAANAAKVDIIQTAKYNGKNEEDALKSFVKSAKIELGNLYVSGNITTQKLSNALHTYCDMDDDEIYWQIDEWDYAKETGSTDGYGKYNRFYTAVQTGKNLKSVIKEYTDNGVGAEKLASEITSHFKPLYKEMSNAERAGIKGYLLNAYALLGYDRSKKSKDIDKWLKD